MLLPEDPSDATRSCPTIAAPGETPCLWSSPAAIGQVRRWRSQAEPASEATTTARITTRIVPTRLHSNPRIASFISKPIPRAPPPPRPDDPEDGGLANVDVPAVDGHAGEHRPDLGEDGVEEDLQAAGA